MRYCVCVTDRPTMKALSIHIRIYGTVGSPTEKRHLNWVPGDEIVLKERLAFFFITDCRHYMHNHHHQNRNDESCSMAQRNLLIRLLLKTFSMGTSFALHHATVTRGSM